MARLLLLVWAMKRLTVDVLRAVLPDLDELRPLMDRLVADSRPDPARTWSGAGALQSLGDRLVDTGELAKTVQRLATEEEEHRRRIYDLAARSLDALARGSHGEAAATFLEAAALEEALDRWDRAEAYADAAWRVARDGDDPLLSSLALRRRGRHRRALSHYGDAARDYEEAYLRSDSAEDPRGAAEALVGWGNVLEEQGRWEEAAERYRRALQVLEALDERMPEAWHALLNLHVVLRSMGQVEASVAPLRQAAQIVEELGDESAVPFLENARGQVEMARGDFQAAEEHLRRAVMASSGSRAEVTVRLNLAETLLATGRTLEAAEEARRAERGALVSRLPQKLPEVYRLLGRIAAREGEADAFVLFERAMEIIRDRGLPALERAQTLQAYGEAEAELGDPEAAASLLSEADGLYRALGIEHRRRRWADRFDAAPESDNEGSHHDE